MNVKGTKIWIIGAARSGIAAAKLLHKHGAQVFVSDANKIEEDYKSVLNELQIPFEEGGHSIETLLKNANLVALSPSVALDKPLPLAAKKAGIPIVSEIEVTSWFLPPTAFCLAITGTNGKSTTTHFAAQLFALGEKHSVACGNYGLPFADALLDPVGYRSFIVEISSYQLETTHTFYPNVSIFLNLQNDHQGRYGSMDEYLKAKWRLVTLTHPDGLAIVDETVLRHALKLGLPLPACRIVVSHGYLETSECSALLDKGSAESNPFRIESKVQRELPVPTYGSIASMPLDALLPGARLTHLWLERNGNSESFKFAVHSKENDGINFEIDITKSCLPGEHNQINIALASLAGYFFGIHPDIIRSQWNASSTAYQHLAHRLEDLVRHCALVTSNKTRRLVRAVNDSKATNVESTIVAVKSFPKAIRLLLGGEPKGDFYGDLIPFVGKNICRIYPFGKAGPLIEKHLAGFENSLAPTSAKMLEAAQKALDDSKDGDIILLSPACASFDEFRNFEHRGDAFRNWVQQHLDK